MPTTDWLRGERDARIARNDFKAAHETSLEIEEAMQREIQQLTLEVEHNGSRADDMEAEFDDAKAEAEDAERRLGAFVGRVREALTTYDGG